VIGGLFFFGSSLLDTLSNQGLAFLMVGAITLMVCLWLGSTFAIDRWYWLPKARRLPDIPSIQSGFFGPPQDHPGPQSTSSRGFRIAHRVSVAVFVFIFFAAFTGFFLRGPSSFFIRIAAFLIYPFAYIAARAILRHFRR
ncbi:MAG TPA: hypothetical protein VL181_07055, partial [Holophagaceae bacterium]|nr:hypothetical protein [Holophagaceae bacterium]